MNSKLKHLYTDTPELHPKLFLGSLQLLFWLFFHPSAWRHYILCLDSNLPADVRLAELKAIHWQNPAWRRLLMMIYLILPLTVNLLIGLGLYLFGASGTEVVYSVVFGLAYGVLISVGISYLISLPMGALLATTIGAASHLMLHYPLIGVALYGFSAGAAVAVALDITKRGSNSLFIRRMGGVMIAGLWLIIYLLIDISLDLPILLVALISTFLGVSQTMWRSALLYPFMTAWNRLLYGLDQRRESGDTSLLRWHSAFWDEHQQRPLRGLEEHLLLVMERYPAEYQAAIEFLSRSHQEWAIQAAQIELDARRLEGCTDLEAISQASADLVDREWEGPASALRRSFSRISQEVEEVQRARQQSSHYYQRLALSAIEERLDSLLREMTRSSDQYVVRFQPIAIRWRKIVADEMRTLELVAEEIPNPYICGIRLTAHQKEIFVGRTDITKRIEQLLLDARRPPLLLYGQRRIGKTSLLLNLSRLLPSTIIPLFVDVQNLIGGRSYSDFLYNMAKQMINSAKRERDLILPSLSRESLIEYPFTCFNDWLDEVEQSLQGPQLALLVLDELEALEERPNEEATDFLRMLRHLIQHRSRFKVLLAGAHTLSEFQDWSSYLINVQVIKISYLSEKETKKLVEHPVKEFYLRYEADASQRIYYLTRGHPYLVQLVCYEMVELKNEQPPAKRRLASLADVEAAAQNALDSAHIFFTDIERNQVDQKGVALLRYLAAQGEGAIVKRDILAKHFPDELDLTLKPLLQRDLIEPVGDGYRFQVELIRRWFAKKDE